MLDKMQVVSMTLLSSFVYSADGCLSEADLKLVCYVFSLSLFYNGEIMVKDLGKEEDLYTTFKKFPYYLGLYDLTSFKIFKGFGNIQ